MSQKITQTHLQSLKYNCCDRCGEVHRPGMGIYERINLPCYNNRATYQLHVGSGFVKMFNEAMADLYGDQTENSMTPWYKLLDDQRYTKAMPDFDTASDFEKKVYYWLRQDEIKHTLRLRKLVEAEKDFFYSY